MACCLNDSCAGTNLNMRLPPVLLLYVVDLERTLCLTSVKRFNSVHLPLADMLAAAYLLSLRAAR